VKRFQSKKDQIMAAALKNLAYLGLHNTNFRTIAETAQLDQALVVYYFKSKDKIFETTWAHYDQQLLSKTQKSLEAAPLGLKKLSIYIQVSFELFMDSKEIGILFFNLHYLAVYDQNARNVLSQVNSEAVMRIYHILLEAQKLGEIILGVDLLLTARTLHSALLGNLFQFLYAEPEYKWQTICQHLQESLVSPMTYEAKK
jgi:AcrR family transcriptional regulator